MRRVKPAKHVPKIDIPRAGACSNDSGHSVEGTPTEPATPIPLSREWRRCARAMGENKEWLEAHEAEILQRHPEWEDQYIVVASGTPSKILAVDPDRIQAMEAGVRSAELLELAQGEGVPPEWLASIFSLGTAWLFSDH